MKVLFVGHTYLTSFNRHKLRLISQMGVKIGLLTPSNWRNLDGLFINKPSPIEEPERDNAFPIFGAPVWRAGHSASFIYSPFVVRRAISEFEPDLIQVEQELYSFAAAPIAFQASQKHKIVIFSWENLDRAIHPLQRIARGLALRRADGIISGNSAGIRLIRQWGFEKPTKLLPQVGVDPSLYSERQLDAAASPARIGFVGRMVHEKGGDILLGAAAILAKQGLDFRLEFCGTGPLASEWQALATKLNLDSRITWHGAVPHSMVPELLAKMDILVLPSRTIPSWAEQFGLVLAQAMIAGAAVVGSDCGAIPEVIGRNEAIFPENDARALAVILKALITDPDKLALWRKADRDRALLHYTAQNIALESVRFWESLL
jgi:glycosyltransferase involved in cell wall biosynthesis